jgi:hypothetical protein
MEVLKQEPRTPSEGNRLPTLGIPQ